MALIAQQTREVTRRFVRRLAAAGETTALTRPQLAQVIGAVDTRVATGVATIAAQVATATGGAVNAAQIARLIADVLAAQQGEL